MDLPSWSIIVSCRLLSNDLKTCLVFLKPEYISGSLSVMTDFIRDFNNPCSDNRGIGVYIYMCIYIDVSFNVISNEGKFNLDKLEVRRYLLKF